MRPSPLLTWPGAVGNPADDPDLPVPAHYGDPLREQGLLVAGRAVTALARDVVAVTGADRLSWLTTLSSQDLTGLVPGDGGAEALVLDANGRIVHALSALDDGRRLLLLTEAGRGPALADFLDTMRFMLRVEVEQRTDLAVLGAMGPGAEHLETAALAHPAALEDPSGDSSASASADGPGPRPLFWRDPWPGVVAGGTSYDVGLTRPHPGTGYEAGWVIVPTARVLDVTRSFLAAVAGSGMAGSLAWEALRVEAGRPRWAREVDERAIPHELDWLRTAVHLAKGCYPGQETVARTLNLGRPPRRLTVLQLDGLTGELPVPGGAVRLGERVVGAVTSVVRHHDYGPLALALVRRATPPDATLGVDLPAASDRAGGPEQVAGAQEPLVSPEGRAQASPEQRPGTGLRRGLLR